ncbi:RecB family exonuclease [Pasteurella multocida]|uniref:RecB family exonuclease n=1 Tax=Pasteurella multocida TaxID=747 RepID=UPI00027B20AB|nr:PD-(D/E)XK nuclease family protein [Pasteurella multocida]APB80179.1 hypothetical protein BMF22_09155 [Pasteurella multocida]EJS83430.1 hypothetical protein KCU_10728 [Pasteurella multocida subsp. multocida str. P52VAC]KEP93653.1 hypothetical protein UQU_0205270 [Pasteurella multocida subsp. multocida VTCCBAA264]KLT47935.1 hypothetical protein PVACC_05175 [Pasteurella multocida subsp. multocida]KLT50687.1 hypothetical protein PMTX1_04990 [Pasteurella multocida subsp. multocida]
MKQFKPDGAVGKAITPVQSNDLPVKVFVPKPHKDKNEVDTTFEAGSIKTWSFSSLSTYEECPRRLAFRRIDKIEEPSSEAMSRGSEIHDLAERFVRGQEGDEVPPALMKFEKGFLTLKKAFEDGIVFCEDEWSFDKDWSESEWLGPKCWHMAKLDCFVKNDDGSALIIDYKTGRKFGNELKHGEQGLVYAIAAFMRYPELDFIKVEFWYLDKGEKLTRQYTRQQALIFHPQLHQRAKEMTTATEFPARPSLNACRFCFYGKEGHCKEKFDASML